MSAPTRPRKRIIGLWAALALIAAVPGFWLLWKKFRAHPAPSSAPPAAESNEDPRWEEYDDAAEQWALLSRPLRKDIPTIAGLILRYRRQTVPNDNELPFEACDDLIKRIDALGYLKLLNLAKKAQIDPDERMLAAYAQRLEDLGDFQSPPGSDALENWVSILMYCERQALLDHSKPHPSIVDSLAAGTPRMSLYLVEFKADDYLSQVPRPSREELDDFFDRHRAVSPLDDPMGIGYRIPRVRLEWLTISPRAIAQSISDDELQEIFAQSPEWIEDDPAKLAAAKLKPTTGPAAAPAKWDDLTDAQKSNLRRQHAAKAAEAMAIELRRRMVLDFHESSESPNSTTRVDAPYRSARYLARLAAIPSRWSTAKPGLQLGDRLIPFGEAAALPQIGPSRTSDTGETFDRYIAACAARLTSDGPNDAPQKSSELALFEPSGIFVDAQGNRFIFRIVEADSGVFPASPAEIKSLVSDWGIAQAYSRARQAAEQFIPAARQQVLTALDLAVAPKDTGLLPAAATQTSDPQERAKLMHIYPLACELRSAGYAHHELHPAGIVELKAQRSVYLVQVADEPWR